MRLAAMAANAYWVLTVAVGANLVGNRATFPLPSALVKPCARIRTVFCFQVRNGTRCVGRTWQACYVRNVSPFPCLVLPLSIYCVEPSRTYG